jgi:GNAT superfamily N-acetyltransferase
MKNLLYPERTKMADMRRAVESDVPRCAELLGILFSQEHEFTPDAELQSKGLLMIIHKPELGRIFVAEVDGVIQGMVMLLFTVSTFLGQRVALLEDMVVDPAWRGKGLGSLLMDHVLHFARREGLGRITLLTDRDNEGAQQFYASKSFTRSGMVVFRKLLSSSSNQESNLLQ